MSRFSGGAYQTRGGTSWLGYGRGARARVRELKRLEAIERNARTLAENRRQQCRRDLQQQKTNPTEGRT